ncbi:hypothetical protein GCM10025776_03470 [Corallincola platygyrae]
MARHWLGGGDDTLNIKLAGHILDKCHKKPKVSFEEVKQAITAHASMLKDVKLPPRQKRMPSEVDEYIRRLLTRDTSISATKALRQFRDDGNSFEEKRFRARFAEVIGKLSR